METESVWRRGRGPGKLGQLVGLNATLSCATNCGAGRNHVVRRASPTEGRGFLNGGFRPSETITSKEA